MTTERESLGMPWRLAELGCEPGSTLCKAVLLNAELWSVWDTWRVMEESTMAKLKGQHIECLLCPKHYTELSASDLMIRLREVQWFAQNFRSEIKIVFMNAKPIEDKWASMNAGHLCEEGERSQSSVNLWLRADRQQKAELESKIKPIQTKEHHHSIGMPLS